MRLNTVASENQETGYGRMGRNILAGLRRASVELAECSSPDAPELPVCANAL